MSQPEPQGERWTIGPATPGIEGTVELAVKRGPWTPTDIEVVEASSLTTANQQIEELRAENEALKERDGILAAIEHDYGKRVAAEAQRDTLRERLAKLEGPHVLVLSPDRWTIEHSLACRESGRMAECELHVRVADWIDEIGEPDLPKGRYLIGDGPLPDALTTPPAKPSE